LKLDVAHRTDAITQARRGLVIHLVRRGVHLAHQFVLHIAALSGQEVLRLAHQLGIARPIDTADAGRAATLDLEQ